MVKRRNIGKLFDVNTGFNIVRSFWNMVDAAQQHCQSGSMHRATSIRSQPIIAIVKRHWSISRTRAAVMYRASVVGIENFQYQTAGTSSLLLNWVIIVPFLLAIISEFQNSDRHPSQSRCYNATSAVLTQMKIDSFIFLIIYTYFLFYM